MRATLEAGTKMKNVKIEKTSDPRVMQLTMQDGRFYEVSGKYYPSVTWILNSYPKGVGFYRWLAQNGNWKEAEEVKETAGARGTNVHRAIEELLAGKRIHHDSLNADEYQLLLDFKKFWEDKKPQLIATEIVCFSKKYGYAGSVDAVVVLDDKVTILDWKTGSKLYITHNMQVAAYAEALREMKQWDAVQVGIVRLGSNHKVGYECKLLDEKETKEAFDWFKTTHKIFKIEHTDAKPKIVEFPDSIELDVVRA